MVQIIEEAGRPKFAERAGRALMGGASALMQFLGAQRKKELQEQELAKEIQAGKRMGLDLTGIPPESRKKAFEKAFEEKFAKPAEQRKFQREQELQEEKAILDFKKQKKLLEEKYGLKKNFVDQVLGEKPETLKPPFKQQKKASLESFDPTTISDEDIIRISAIDSALGNQLRAVRDTALEQKREEKKEKRAEFREEREFAYKRAGKILEEADKERTSLPVLEASVDAMEDAISTNDLSFMSLDNLAEKTGIELFRSAAGGQFKAAGKTFLVSNVSKFGARPNMYIEQQVADMLPKIGRSKEANLTALELIKFEKDIKSQRVKIIDDLEDKFLETKGFVPSNFGKVVDKSMKKYVIERQKELTSRLKQLQMQEKTSERPGKVAPGTPLTDEKALEYMQKANGDRKTAERMAKDDGYIF